MVGVNFVALAVKFDRSTASKYGGCNPKPPLFVWLCGLWPSQAAAMFVGSNWFRRPAPGASWEYSHVLSSVIATAVCGMGCV